MSTTIKVDGLLSTREYEISDWDMEHNPYLAKWALAHTDPEKFLEELRAKETDPMQLGLLGDDFQRKLKYFMLSFIARGALIPDYGFAIPSWNALDAIKRHSPAGVLEIGAGTGYWAMLLGKLGVDIVAYDAMTGQYRDGLHFGKHAEILKGTHKDALSIKAHHMRTLLLCWPDYSDGWAAEALRLYRGDIVAYVGEGDGGCTADDAFYETLDTDWNLVEECEIPQWHGLHDRLEVYKRKGD